MSQIAKCNCSGQTCGCRIVAGAGVSIEGSGTPRDPWVVSAAGGEGGGGGFIAGDTKDTVRTDTPAGWLECNGQTVSRTAYAELFAAIGTRWGAGDGFSTFNVPQFGGRHRVGAGPGYTLGASGGAADTTLVVANLPAHTHTIGNHVHDLQNHTHSDAHDHGATGTESALHTHPYSFPNSDTIKVGTGANKNVGVPGGAETRNTGGQPERHTHTVPAWGGRTDGPTPNGTSSNGAQTTSSTGQGAAFTNLPPYRVVRVLIKT